MCSRCGRGDLRLIRGALCVSCYNREREVVKGINARGVPPTKLSRLDPRAICYASNGGVHVRRSERTAGLRELVVATLREATHQVAFGWRAPRHAMRQLRLFG